MSIFHTNCTIPPEGVNFVYPPNTRGTLDILWNSLATLLLCTWTVQHPPVPLKKLRRREQARQKLWEMLVALMTPEFLMGRALADMISACEAKEMGKLVNSWSLTHAHFANMGGFVIRFGSETLGATVVVEEAGVGSGLRVGVDHLLEGTEAPMSRTGLENEEPIGLEGPEIIQLTPTDHIITRDGDMPSATRKARRRKSLVDEAISRLEEISVEVPKVGNAKTRRKNIKKLKESDWSPDAPQLLLAKHLNIIRAIPNISEDELNDKSKGDILVKGLVVIQVVWLIVQLIVRGVRRLPSSLLEIVVLAFSACTFITYLLSLSKPQDIQIPLYITADRYPSAEEIKDLGLFAPNRVFTYDVHQTRISLRRVNSLAAIKTQEFITHMGRTRYPIWPIFIISVGSGVGAVLFGLLHCIAWNFGFPTSIERRLWRVASVISIVIPVAMVISNLCLSSLTSRIERGRSKRVAEISDNYRVRLMYLLLVPYLLARLCIMVECFRDLCFLSPEAFLSTWSSFPHAG